MVSILGENINLVRPSLIHRPTRPKTVWRIRFNRRARTIKLSLNEMKRIAREMGHPLKGVENDQKVDRQAAYRM